MYEFFKLRYLFLLMGIFSTYCGFIYNDMTSIPLTILGDTCYDTVNNERIQKADCVYSFGIDPIWFTSGSDLTFFNSLKMKMSVIIGVA